MNRREVLATAATSVGASIALTGCLGVSGDGSSAERDITDAAIETDHAELTAEVNIGSDFTDSAPGTLTIELTNHEVERVMMFHGTEAPRIGSLEHADESAEVLPLPIDHIPDAKPEAPTDGCWVHETRALRPDIHRPVELDPGETYVVEYALAAPKPRDDEPFPDPCLPGGTYTGTSDEDYQVATSDSEDPIHGWFTTTLDVMIEEL